MIPRYEQDVPGKQRAVIEECQRVIAREDDRRSNAFRHLIIQPRPPLGVGYGVETDEPVERLGSHPLARGMGVELVFVNGRYAPGLSRSRDLPAGVKIGSLAAAMKEDRERIELHLARHARYQDHAFTALNTALMEDGAFVYIPRGTVLEAPIHLLFVATTRGEAIAVHPRNLVIAEIRGNSWPFIPGPLTLVFCISQQCFQVAGLQLFTRQGLLDRRQLQDHTQYCSHGAVAP